jgi:hypothetical protein
LALGNAKQPRSKQRDPMRMTTLVRRTLGVTGLVVDDFGFGSDGLVAMARPRWRRPLLFLLPILRLDAGVEDSCSRPVVRIRRPLLLLLPILRLQAGAEDLCSRPVVRPRRSPLLLLLPIVRLTTGVEDLCVSGSSGGFRKPEIAAFCPPEPLPPDRSPIHPPAARWARPSPPLSLYGPSSCASLPALGRCRARRPPTRALGEPK